MKSNTTAAGIKHGRGQKMIKVYQHGQNHNRINFDKRFTFPSQSNENGQNKM
jgi:hypothetical protein